MLVDHEARREALTRAAAEQIRRVGLEGVRLRAVAETAGVTTGGLSYYFPDKRALLLATYRARRDNSEAHIVSALKAGRSTLEASIEGALPLDADRSLNWRVWMAFWAAAADDPELEAEHVARTDGYLARLLEGIREEQAAGRMGAGIDAGDAAARLLTVVTGVSVHATLAPHRWPPKRQRRLLDEELESLRRADGPNPKPSKDRSSN